jgi:adenylate kinase family enzyme
MPVQERPTVVELVGLAGAGKSTLARELDSGLPEVQLGLLLSRPASAVAQLVAMAPFALPYLRHTNGTAWFTRDQVRGLGYLHAWERSLRHNPPAAGAVLLDHGPLFLLATLDAFGPPVTATATFRRWWERTLDGWADLLDVVIWLDAPEPLLIERIRSREQRHVLRGADDPTSRQFLHRYRTSYERVLERVDRCSPGAVLSLRTDTQTPSVLAAQVTQRLSPGAELDV